MAQSPSVSESSPNFIVINTDDLDAGSMRHFRRLDSMLADKGITFKNAFVTNPTCCPSRASMLRGQYTRNHKVFWNNVGDRDVPRGGLPAFRHHGHERDNLATRLKDAGYRTSLVGKYMNHYKGGHIPPGWDDWHAWIGVGAGGGKMNENGRIVHHQGWADYDGTQTHQTDIVADRGEDFIRSSEGPFFLYVPERAPHGPAIPPKRHEDAYPNLRLPRPPSFNENSLAGKPRYIRSLKKLGLSEIRRARELHRKRVQSMLAVEDMVEGFIATLRNTDRLDNTYIIFTSDNGFHLGQHRLRPGKLTPYDTDVRVPLIVRGPGVPEGATRQQIAAASNDIMPTLLDLAGEPIPGYVDGRSLAPLLTNNPPSRWRERLMIEQYRVPGSALNPVPTFQGIVTQNRSYVEYRSRERELYALDKDPHQLVNRASKWTKARRQFHGQLERLKRCKGSTCRVAEGG